MAGTIAVANWTQIRNSVGAVKGLIMELTCTAHTDATFSAALTAAIMKKISGMSVYSVKCIYDGVTPVTTDSDLEITDSDGLSLLGSNGTNFVDNNSVTETAMYNTFLTANVLRVPIESEVWTLALTNNAVASAVFTLKFYLIDA
jgi:hypothetical protein